MSSTTAAKEPWNPGWILALFLIVSAVRGCSQYMQLANRSPQSVHLTDADSASQVDNNAEMANLLAALAKRRSADQSQAPDSEAKPESSEQAGEEVESDATIPANKRLWTEFGMRLTPLGEDEKALVGPRYRGGMRVTQVRANSLAAANGIQRGDILVGLHIWETVNSENVNYVLEHPQLRTFSPIKFYVLRGEETLSGQLQLDDKNVE